MEQLEGQINFLEFITEFEKKLDSEPTEGDFSSYRSNCDFCDYNRHSKCFWNDECKTQNSHWLPNGWKIPRLCGSCKYSNSFVHQGDFLKPIESPNIYCTHKLGSLNRQSAYPDKVVNGFGVGSWNRQHEFDTCERWESRYGKS